MKEKWEYEEDSKESYSHLRVITYSPSHQVLFSHVVWCVCWVVWLLFQDAGELISWAYNIIDFLWTSCIVCEIQGVLFVFQSKKNLRTAWKCCKRLIVHGFHIFLNLQVKYCALTIKRFPGPDHLASYSFSIPHYSHFCKDI